MSDLRSLKEELSSDAVVEVVVIRVRAGLLGGLHRRPGLVSVP